MKCSLDESNVENALKDVHYRQLDMNIYRLTLVPVSMIKSNILVPGKSSLLKKIDSKLLNQKIGVLDC